MFGKFGNIKKSRKNIIRGRKSGEIIFALSILAAVAGTVAYFTSWRNLRNTFSVGYNEIKIVEKYDPPQELKEGINSYTKRVQIQNTGSIPCYLRAAVKFSDSDIADISEISPDGKDYYAAEEYAEHLPENWVYIAEDEDALLGGFYYYTERLAPGKQSAPLLEKVQTAFSNAESVCAYEIFVYSESVQVLDQNGEEFTGNEPYLEAWREFLQPVLADDSRKLSVS